MKKKLLNIGLVFSIFLIYFISLVPLVSANANVTDNMIFGSLINASQGGRSSGYNSDVERAGSHMLGGQRKQGSRFPTIKRGGGKVGFNPSHVDIDILYNDYTSYVKSFDYSDKWFVVPINQVFSRSPSDIKDDALMHGIQWNDNSPLKANENTLLIDLPKTFKYVYVDASSLNIGSSDSTGSVTYRRNYSGDFDGSLDYRVRTLYETDNFKKFKALSIDSFGSFHGLILNRHSMHTVSWSVNQLIFSDYSDVTLDDINFIHSADNFPTKQEFINNYTNRFNVEYDNSTNQLIKNDKYYTYNENDFIDNSITINGDYIVVNGDYIEGNDGSVGEQMNYTSLLERLLQAIKNLPKEIAEKIEPLIPDVVSEAGTNIWDFLIQIVEGLSGIGQSIIDAFVSSLEFIIETFLSLIIPSSESMDNHKNKMNNLTDTFAAKFDFILKPISDLKSIFSSPKSFYDVSFTLFETKVFVLPEIARPVIDKLKPVLNGFVVIATFIYIYKKSQPDEVI